MYPLVTIRRLKNDQRIVV